MFDKRISQFAREKFQRGNIDMKMNFKVVRVSDKAITMTNQDTGETSLNYGMAVWSAGIGTRPIIHEFMKEVDQANRRVLATDEWLRVLGTDCVYALGDCASINQWKIMEDISSIFKKADKTNSGTLTAEQMKEVLDDIIDRYPQVVLYLKNKHMKTVLDLLKDADGNSVKGSLDIEQFKKALADVDSQVKMLPPTAQVAAQEGTYLAKCFNKMKQCEANPEGPPCIREPGQHRFQPFRSFLRSLC